MRAEGGTTQSAEWLRPPAHYLAMARNVVEPTYLGLRLGGRQQRLEPRKHVR